MVSPASRVRLGLCSSQEVKVVSRVRYRSRKLALGMRPRVELPVAVPVNPARRTAVRLHKGVLRPIMMFPAEAEAGAST